jgi:drug/metabolite transporter (DMT)-like permease
MNLANNYNYNGNTRQKSTLFILIATLAFSMMAISVKLLHRIPPSEIILIRSLFSATLCYYFLKRLKINPWGSRSQRKMLVLRGIVGTLSLISYFTTIQNLPLALAEILQQMAPFFALLISQFFLNEKNQWHHWFFLFIAFIGVVIINREVLQNFSSWGNLHGSQIWYFQTGIASAFLSACAFATIRAIGAEVHPLVIIFYFPIVTIPFALVAAYWQWITPNLIEILYLALVGITTQAGQYYMTRAYQLAPVRDLALIRYLGIVFALIMGYWIWDEHYDAYTLGGMFLILISTLLGSYVNFKGSASGGGTSLPLTTPPPVK